MLGKTTLVAGLLAIGTMLASAGASAAPALPQSTPAIEGLVQQVKHRHRHHRHRSIILGLGGVGLGLGLGYGYGYGPGYRYCGGWRHECAARWGWGTRGFHRCLWRHGC